MADEKLVNAIKLNLDKGFDIVQIRSGLLEKGWPVMEVDEAIKSAKPMQATQQSKPLTAVQPNPQYASQPAGQPKKSNRIWLIIGIIIIFLILVVGAFLVYQ